MLSRPKRLAGAGLLRLNSAARRSAQPTLVAHNPFACPPTSKPPPLAAALPRRPIRPLELAAAGHVKPLHICKTFGWDEVHDAMRFMRDGKHFGKVVVSSSVGDRETLTVPVRPALRQLRLRSDVSYLIAGGLKGLCGSLAIYMARHGATNLVVMSRSGCSDDLSQAVLHHCAALGTHVDFIQGDVTNIDDVRRCFVSASKPIGGIIQGAMVD